MLTKGIDTSIRDLVAALPKNLNKANPQDFEALLAPLAKEIGAAIAEAAGKSSTATSTTSSAATATDAPAATTTGASPTARLNALQLSLLRDKSSPMFEQLANNLTAGDPQYNQRESSMRDRLDLSAIEQRLRGYARSHDVSFDQSDLDGVLRNAGYDATHLGSSERYMNAIEKYIGEAEKNYQKRAGNVPNQNA